MAEIEELPPVQEEQAEESPSEPPPEPPKLAPKPAAPKPDPKRLETPRQRGRPRKPDEELSRPRRPRPPPKPKAEPKPEPTPKREPEPEPVPNHRAMTPDEIDRFAQLFASRIGNAERSGLYARREKWRTLFQ